MGCLRVDVRIAGGERSGVGDKGLDARDSVGPAPRTAWVLSAGAGVEEKHTAGLTCPPPRVPTEVLPVDPRSLWGRLEGARGAQNERLPSSRHRKDREQREAGLKLKEDQTAA